MAIRFENVFGFRADTLLAPMQAHDLALARAHEKEIRGRAGGGLADETPYWPSKLSKKPYQEHNRNFSIYFCRCKYQSHAKASRFGEPI